MHRPYRDQVQRGRSRDLLRVIALIVPALLVSCTIGEGEGPRYTGRVVSVDEHELCLGPNSSSRTGTCGSIPEGATKLPGVGDCVSLFGHPFDNGSKEEPL